MKYSVCILHWNWLEVLQPTIENLRKERETVDLEIIVLDNGSEDGSREWLFQQIKDITIIFNNKNVGAAVGRNQMLNIAKGEYILMLDSDILYANGSIEYLAKRFENQSNNVMCIGFNPQVFHNNMNNYTGVLPSLDAPLKKHDFQSASYALTQYGLFKSKMFEACSFDESFGVGYGFEDDDLFYQMCDFGWEVHSVDFEYYHAKNTDKWKAVHEKSMVNYYDRHAMFRMKWWSD